MVSYYNLGSCRKKGESTMALTKADIITEVISEHGYSRHQATETVEALLELIKSTLESGEDVLISGFGKFCVKDKRERRGRNPARGNELILEARRVVTFKCSSKLKKKLNGKG